jgi:hypothetical protein
MVGPVQVSIANLLLRSSNNFLDLPVNKAVALLPRPLLHPAPKSTHQEDHRHGQRKTTSHAPLIGTEDRMDALEATGGKNHVTQL